MAWLIKVALNCRQCSEPRIRGRANGLMAQHQGSS